MIKKKRKFCCPSGSSREKERMWKKERQVLGPCQRTKNSVKQQGDSDTNWDWPALNCPRSFGIGVGRFGNWKMRRDYLNCDAKLTKIPKRDFIFRTCEDGAGWHLIPYRISPVQSSSLRQIRTGILREGII